MPPLKSDTPYYAGRPKSAGKQHYFLSRTGTSQCRKARAVDCMTLTPVAHFDPLCIGVCAACARMQPRPAAYYGTPAKGGAA